MRDPHVERLIYRVTSHQNIRYDDPEQLTVSNDLGEFKLIDGKLTVCPSEHFPTGSAAREAIDPYLRSWEIETDLTSQIGSIRFEFDRADLLDRDPPKPGESAVLTAESGSLVLVGEDISMILTRKKYPDPPLAFTTTPGRTRYHGEVEFRKGRSRDSAQGRRRIQCLIRSGRQMARGSGPKAGIQARRTCFRQTSVHASNPGSSPNMKRRLTMAMQLTLGGEA